MSDGPRNPWQRWEDRDTRKTAIDAMCWQCMGGSADEKHGVREEIRNCTASNCPLYAWKPYRLAKEVK